MSLPYEQLKTFITFVESKNIYEASERLGCTQPGVTHRLKSLEEYLGKPLFINQGKKKIPNKLGQELYQNLAPQFDELELQLKRSLRKFEDPALLEIKVAGRREILSELQERFIFPGQITFLNLNNQQALDALASDKVDYILIHDPPSSAEFIKRKVMEVSFHFLIHRKFFGKRKITLSQFKDHQFLERTPYLGYNQRFPHMTDWCRKVKFPLNQIPVKREMDDWMTIVQMVEQGLGYTLCSNSFSSSSKEVRTVPVDSTYLKPTPFYILYRKELRKLIPIGKVIRAC